ncbi:2-dehydro-3-deoxygalactonokinase [Anseongella ginsenosidimutans]|uniref:2-dehydro-3-deoxygalactonokinase n=1 Tax=Anseongella ginsenosidimutans TaxID=496056 RepID=A0A4R3KQN9_9SPHI|nr:2-dehydro-3-deoxygalactonokinase [Anseongella ginsenosidimutans]QEC52851.1 2-dehydro-3-deoxygalactonokinase [Anseongella ginsenosidimutans]TCS87238.1 2-dehydro-3-deoxygalactonokinase [Anseongella ginsenosidimutans]
MGNPPEKYLLSCDWGTTSFRLRLLNQSDGRVMTQLTAAEGVAAVYSRWKEQGSVDRLEFYCEVLKTYLAILSKDVSFSLNGIPMVISGMASSSIGMKELPYAALPFLLDCSNTICEKLESPGGIPHDILLVSGVKSSQDVMRGEETQLLGLAGSFPVGETGMIREAAASREGAVFIFPGTHSKHIRVKAGAIVDFDTFITGEMFQLLTRHSILKETLEKPESEKMTAGNLNAFLAGVRHPGVTNLLQSIFSARTNYLFEKLDKAGNFCFLSGLLIGAELESLRERKTGAVILCGGSNVSAFYEPALRELKLPVKTLIVSPGLADNAASFGHLLLFQQLQ